MSNNNLATEFIGIYDKEEQAEIATTKKQYKLINTGETFPANKSLPKFKRISLNEPFPINKSLQMGKPILRDSHLLTLNLFFQIT
jgi:hypothetical protein